MTTYTIDTENSITAFDSKQDAGEGETFASQKELASLVANWPANRLIEVWNVIPDLTPVKKFTDWKSAVSRIWKAKLLAFAHSAIRGHRRGTQQNA
jgi:hypothetical protein